MGFSIFRVLRNDVQRRSNHRIKLFATGMLEWAEGEVPANFLNISRTGALIKLRKPPVPEERLTLSWQGRNYGGICRWRKGRRCGIQFEHTLSTADMAMLLAG